MQAAPEPCILARAISSLKIFGRPGALAGQPLDQRPASLPRAASIGLSPSYPLQLRSAPRPSRYSADCRCPPWHAHHKAWVISSGGGASGREGRGAHEVNADAPSSEKCFSTRSISPNAAACQSVVRAPRSTNRRAAFHCPNATASASGVPPPITAPGASISAPPSRSVSSTSTSSLLAGQWSGVSVCGPVNRALTSAPAAISAATVWAPFGKCPGQSVATCSNDRDIPLHSLAPSLAVARPGFSFSSRFNDSTSP